MKFENINKVLQFKHAQLRKYPVEEDGDVEKKEPIADVEEILKQYDEAEALGADLVNAAESPRSTSLAPGPTATLELIILKYQKGDLYARLPDHEAALEEFSSALAALSEQYEKNPMLKEDPMF